MEFSEAATTSLNFETESSKLEPSARKQENDFSNQASSSSVNVSLVFGGVALLVLILLAYVVHLFRRKNLVYEDIPETRKRPSRCSQASIYSASRPIDFILPSTPPISSSESLDLLPLWARVALLEPGPTLLGGLNPELYLVTTEGEGEEERNFPDGHLGRVWIGLQYDSASERLLVSLLKVKNLPSRVLGCNNCCDPFVRINVLPDERRYVQSKMKRKTCNPKFDEKFLFQMPSKNMDERILKATVLDSDRGKHYNVLGHALFPLGEIDQSSTEMVVLYKDLIRDRDVDDNMPRDAGELLVSLCYNENLERLTVTICEAKGLKTPEGVPSLDTIVKLFFMLDKKQVKSKKTQIVKKSVDPKYNESFHFRLPQKQLDSATVMVQVTCVNPGPGKDKVVGRLVFGSYMFVRGKPLQHWNETMSARHKQIRHWQKLAI